MDNVSYSKKIAIGGLLTALAIIFSYIESLIPFNLGIPGIKIGLANVVILFSLYNMNYYSAFLINIIRVAVVGFMFGNMTSILFSMCGAFFSFGVMALMHRFSSRHIVVISVLGAIFHVIGQLIVGLCWYPFDVLLYYGIFLLIAAFGAGIIIGMLVNILNGYYNKLHK